eukprot:12152366-Alexandrium_andersonii.AAC.1
MAGSHWSEGALAGRGMPCGGRPQTEQTHSCRAPACRRARSVHVRQQEVGEARALPRKRALRLLRR